jgi:hypothetical protein
LQQILGTKARKGSCPTGSVAEVSLPNCFLLAPAFLTQDDVQTADAVYDETTGNWVVNVHVASSARRRFLGQMNRLINQKLAMVIDGQVANEFEVHPGVTGSDVQISSHAKWTMEQAVATAGGIAPPSTPPCTASSCAPTTDVLDVLAKRCDAVTPSVGASTGVASASEMSAGTARAAFERAHVPIPTALAKLAANEEMAFCHIGRPPTIDGSTPTTVCPDGSRVMAGPAAFQLYVVGADLAVIRLPAVKYVFPDTPKSVLDPCYGTTP